jgi:hypothetical protein
LKKLEDILEMFNPLYGDHLTLEVDPESNVIYYLEIMMERAFGRNFHGGD